MIIRAALLYWIAMVAWVHSACKPIPGATTNDVTIDDALDDDDDLFVDSHTPA